MEQVRNGGYSIQPRDDHTRFNEEALDHLTRTRREESNRAEMLMDRLLEFTGEVMPGQANPQLTELAVKGEFRAKFEEFTTGMLPGDQELIVEFIALNGGQDNPETSRRQMSSALGKPGA